MKPINMEIFFKVKKTLDIQKIVEFIDVGIHLSPFRMCDAMVDNIALFFHRGPNQRVE